MTARLKQITDNLLEDPLHYANARNAAIDLYDYFIAITDLQSNIEINDDHIKTENGLAISTNSAAFCIIDFMRTRNFLLGIKKAIEDCLAIQPSKPVELMYAGTGPFATLAIPLISYFTALQLQFVFLEINTNSIDNLNKVIKKLGAEAYVKAIIQCDACNYSFDKNIQPAIILSETMKPALNKEPQIMLMSNLTKQCIQPPICIPQSISVSVGSLNVTSKEITLLHTLLDFNLETAIEISKPNNKLPLFNKGLLITLKENTFGNRFALFTTIHTYNNHMLYTNDSSLTLPWFLDPLMISNKEITLQVKYNVGEQPGFVFEKLDL